MYSRTVLGTLYLRPPKKPTMNTLTEYSDIGDFQLVDLIIKELKGHMICYNSMPLIC